MERFVTASNRPAEMDGRGRKAAADSLPYTHVTRARRCPAISESIRLLRMNGIGRPLPREVPYRSNDFAGKEVKGKNRRGLSPCARFGGRVAALPLKRAALGYASSMRRTVRTPVP